MAALLKPVMVNCPHRLCVNGVERHTGRDCQLCAGKGELPIEFAEKGYLRPVKERETIVGKCSHCGRVALVLSVPGRELDEALCSDCYTQTMYPDRYTMTPAEAAALPF